MICWILNLVNLKNKVKKITGKSIFAFSYPNGSISHREINAAKKYYKIAFSTKPNNISASADLYTLPRYALTGDYMRDLLKMYGIWKYIKGCCEKITRTFKA